MQTFMRPLRLSADEIEVRPAQRSDQIAIGDLTENNRHMHFNLEWWTFEDWQYPDRSSDAIWIAQHDAQPIGVVAIPIDASPIAWIRSAAVADSYAPPSIFKALIDYAAPQLRSNGVQAVVSVAHPDWYADLLAATQFLPIAEVISFRKEGRSIPDLTASATANVLTRPARSIDIPAIIANDRAAFDSVWWYSEKSIAHVIDLVAHF